MLMNNKTRRDTLQELTTC